MRRAVSLDLKSPGNSIYLLGETFRELGGSEYYRLNGFLGKIVPHVRKAEAKRIFGRLTKAIDLGLVKSCHDLSEGGLAVAVSEMAFAGDNGVEIDLNSVPRKNLTRDDEVLFSESNSRFLVEVSQKVSDEFEALMKGVIFSRIGKVTKTSNLCIRGLTKKIVVDASLDDLVKSWKETFGGEV